MNQATGFIYPPPSTITLNFTPPVERTPLPQAFALLPALLAAVTRTELPAVLPASLDHLLPPIPEPPVNHDRPQL